MSTPEHFDDHKDDRHDTSSWHFTSWLQVGKTAWVRNVKRFWRVPEEIHESRMAICRQCRHLNRKKTRCRLCGCSMNIKTWIGGFSCPKGKWTALEPPDATKSATGSQSE